MVLLSYPEVNIHALLLWDVASMAQAVEDMLGVYCGWGTPPLV